MSQRNKAVKSAVSEMADARAVEETLNTPINLVVRSKGGAKKMKDMKADVKDYKGGAGLARMVGSGVTGGAMCAPSPRMVGSGVTGGAMVSDRTELAKKYEALGRQYAEDVRAIEPELVGSGFWEDFGRGFMMPFKAVASVAKPLLPVVAPGVGHIASAGLSALGLGKAPRKQASPDDKRRMRGQAVSKLMKQHGMSLAEASRYVKEHGY
jgi:hypothetical protein